MEAIEFLEDILLLSFEEKVNYAHQAVKDFTASLLDFGCEVSEISSLLEATLKYFVSADGKIGEDERILFSAAMGKEYSVDEFNILANDGNHQALIDAYLDVMSEMPTDAVIAAAVLGSCLMCVDGKCTIEEQEALEDLLSC